MSQPAQLSFSAVLGAPSRPTPTSQEAARLVTPTLKEAHKAILGALRTRGAMTSDAIASAIGKTVLYTRPRLTELYQMGAVKRVGEGKSCLNHRQIKYEAA